MHGTSRHQVATFAPGELLHRQGEPALAAHYVEQGQVRVFARAGGVERTLHIAKAGDVVGISALTPPCAYEATALCVQAARTLRFDLPSLPSLVRELPDVATGLVLRLAERARDAEERIEINMLRDTQSKVVAGLLGAARRAWPNRQQQPVRLALSPLSLSARVGLDVAAVKRVVLQLQQTEYLDIADEQLEIHSLEALQELQALLETGEEILGGSAR